MTLRLFGIRHHGPGCARALRSALTEFAPDCVLLEGPADAEDALALVANPELRPPVALLIHAADDARRAVFYPFVTFSPEWQALRYAVERAIPVRFIDLPMANALARHPRIPRPPTPASEETDAEAEPAEISTREDPLELLARAAGYVDEEQWWDAQVEQRLEATGLFEAIQEAMTELRKHSRERSPREQEREARREAHMRICIRRALRDGFQRIAVVCGAWHVPALAEPGGPKQDKVDRELLKGLPKIKVEHGWIPWTYSRLSYRSGYGAGVDSPGWYAHVWEHGRRAPAVWVVRASRLLRTEDLDASSASGIETVRLAETLATLRGLPAPGLTELRESIVASLCGGDSVRAKLIRERLEIGDELGHVPDVAAKVPLQRDFEKEVKRLRLKLSTEPIALELDLRRDTDRDKSRLLHRLRVLGIEWAEPLGAGNTSGTFRENWHLAWDPELAVDLVAANLYGNTVAGAAHQKLRERAERANVPELASMIEVTLVADLPEAMAPLLAELDARAARSGDVQLLLEATEPLARMIRYGDVRGARATAIEPVFGTLLGRALVGLVFAASQLDDEAAAALIEAVQKAHAGCLLVGSDPLKRDWLDALTAVADAEAAHPRVRGRACRLLLEQGRFTRDELERRAQLSLSAAVSAAQATRWLEGLIGGDASFLVHHETLLETLDAWLATLSPETFQAELPLLRRAFANFAPAERRALARRLKRGENISTADTRSQALHTERARRVLPVLAIIIGADRG